MDGEAWWATVLGVSKSWTRLSDVTSHLITFLQSGFPGGASGKESACRCKRYEMQVLSLGWENPLEEGMATHSNILAWRIPLTRESGGLRSIGSHRVGHD